MTRYEHRCSFPKPRECYEESDRFQSLKGKVDELGLSANEWLFTKRRGLFHCRTILDKCCVGFDTTRQGEFRFFCMPPGYQWRERGRWPLNHKTSKSWIERLKSAQQNGGES